MDHNINRRPGHAMTHLVVVVQRPVTRDIDLGYVESPATIRKSK